MIPAPRVGLDRLPVRVRDGGSPAAKSLVGIPLITSIQLAAAREDGGTPLC
jgi:hypothetical protein